MSLDYLYITKCVEEHDGKAKDKKEKKNKPSTAPNGLP